MLRILSVFACATCALLSVRAYADQFDTLTVNVSTSIIYDSNVFRVADDTALPARLGTTRKSELINVSSVGLKFDKPYGQQRFQAEISETIYRYNTFSFLDFEALDYKGAWQWHLTPRISGRIGAERKKSLVPFQDVRTASFQQSLRTIDDRFLNADVWLSGPWHVLAGVSQLQAEDSRIVTNEQAFDAVTQEAGVKYLARAGSSITFMRRHIDGDYQQSRLDPINLLDNGFQEDQTEVRAQWFATGMSTWSGRIAWIDRRHKNFPQRDFEGVIGNVGYSWAPSGKLRFSAGVRRDLGTWWESLFFSYRRSNGLTFGATWLPSSHTSIDARYDRARFDYDGALVAFGPSRADTEQSARLFLNWTPMRALILRIGIEHSTRTSSVPLSDFDATIGSLSATFTF